MDGTLVPAWVPQIDQNRYRSRKGRLAQNVLAICDFDMNFTYVYAGWEGSAADARVLNHAVSQDPKFRFLQLDLFNHAHSRLRNVIERCFGVLKKRFPILQWGMPSYLLQHQVDLVIACCTLHNFIRMAYRRYLERSGFPQEDHWTLSVEQRLMWMIVDEHPRLHERRSSCRGTYGSLGPRIKTTFWLYPLARRYYQYPEPHYPSMLEIWGPIRLPPIPVEGQSDARHSQNSNVVRSYARGGEEAPIMISNSTTPTAQTHTHIGSWDAVQQVAHGDGGPRLARSISLAPRRSLDMGSGVGGIGSWTDYIRHFGVQSERGGQTHSEGDSWVKLNTDGASKGNPSVARARGIARDYEGKVILAFSEPIRFTNNMVVEMHVVLRGLGIYLERVFLKFGLNWMLFMSFISYYRQVRGAWYIQNMLQHIQIYLKQMEVRISHIFREGNQAADYFANQALEVNEISIVNHDQL
ncbi:UNVERIFIED_CONTAM: putative ribonuclease H protein [Sesamum calycinum]|uniref:Ribonuclease H protein n=1 Tax=Sesamum calycinum TaxID=2727403 RepID=A0AAW2IUM3_9LAMI